MSIFLVLAALFFVGSIGGWVFEVFFRKFVSDSNPEHKWINPGFLVGPYLPIYGFGLSGMFLLCSIPLDFIESGILRTVAYLVMIAIVMTVIEYIAGLIFIKGMHIKLWDYSSRPGNIQSIICPAFSLLWAAAGAIYYFFVHSHIYNGLRWLAQNLAYSFFVGMFFGIIIIDIAYSMQLVMKIRTFAKEKQIAVRYEEFKASIKAHNERARKRGRFIFAFRSDIPLSEQFAKYTEQAKKRGTLLEERIKKIKKK